MGTQIMETLNRWEHAIERWERGLLDRVFRREPVELVDALRRECDRHAVVCSRHRVMVPNAYDVELPDHVLRELAPYGDRIGEELTDCLVRHAEENAYEWAGPPTVHVTRASHVPNGRYRVVGNPMPHIRAEEFDAPGQGTGSGSRATGRSASLA
jgi:Protein of unknown function (DUF3662)